jgi:hypothetical protein
MAAETIAEARKSTADSALAESLPVRVASAAAADEMKEEGAWGWPAQSGPSQASLGGSTGHVRFSAKSQNDCFMIHACHTLGVWIGLDRSTACPERSNQCRLETANPPLFFLILYYSPIWLPKAKMQVKPLVPRERAKARTMDQPRMEAAS